MVPDCCCCHWCWGCACSGSGPCLRCAAVTCGHVDPLCLIRLVGPATCLCPPKEEKMPILIDSSKVYIIIFHKTIQGNIERSEELTVLCAERINFSVSKLSRHTTKSKLVICSPAYSPGGWPSPGSCWWRCPAFPGSSPPSAPSHPASHLGGQSARYGVYHNYKCLLLVFWCVKN